MRKAFIAGNWKMYKSIPEAVSLVQVIRAGVHTVQDVDIVVCPPFTALAAVNEALKDSNIDLGAQDMYSETEGAFTGEISPLMLKDVGCRYVILGHSERRQYFGETDGLVNKKLKTAIKFNLIPIVCIGETLAERDAGKAKEVVANQFEGSFQGLTAEEFERLIIAYEPVWAIGTGRTATPQQAQEMHGLIRSFLKDRLGDTVERVRILYGGSVKPENISELMAEPDVDGALVGGASIKGESFIQIVRGSLLEAKGSGKVSSS
ncbi:MAG: triose-phosphate isomerase [Candidatus Omnitrophica bacterium]|nr:triose-phosphate isomerase [Candidatus Omnitrophota bacterium]